MEDQMDTFRKIFLKNNIQIINFLPNHFTDNTEGIGVPVQWNPDAIYEENIFYFPKRKDNGSLYLSRIAPQTSGKEGNFKFLVPFFTQNISSEYKMVIRTPGIFFIREITEISELPFQELKKITKLYNSERNDPFWLIKLGIVIDLREQNPNIPIKSGGNRISYRYTTIKKLINAKIYKDL